MITRTSSRSSGSIAGSTTIFLYWSMSCELTDSIVPTNNPGGNRSPSPRTPAGHHVVALLSPRAQVDVLDPEVPLEVGPEEPLAVGDVGVRDGRAQLARGGVELGRRDILTPAANSRSVTSMTSAVLRLTVGCGAPDERVLADDDGHLGLDPVLGADVYLDPVGELVAHRRDHPGQRPVLVEGPLPSRSSRSRRSPLQARGLGREPLGLPELRLDRLLIAVVEGARDPLPRLLETGDDHGDRASHGPEDLGGAELDRVQRPALARPGNRVLLHVNGEEREARNAQDEEGRQTSCRA